MGTKCKAEQDFGGFRIDSCEIMQENMHTNPYVIPMQSAQNATFKSDFKDNSHKPFLRDLLEKSIISIVAVNLAFAPTRVQAHIYFNCYSGPSTNPITQCSVANGGIFNNMYNIKIAAGTDGTYTAANFSKVAPEADALGWNYYNALSSNNINDDSFKFQGNLKINVETASDFLDANAKRPEFNTN